MKKLFVPIIIILLFILGFVLYQNSGYKTLNHYNDNKISNLENEVNDLEEKVEDTAKELLEKGDEYAQNLIDNTPVVATPTTPTTTTIYIPQTNGLNMEMVPVTIPYTQSVLKETYKEVFNQYSDSSTDGYNGLSFNSVSIDNGTATVNLGGSWYPVGDMSGYSMRKIINQAAFQYDSVNVVKVNINGQLFDWCVDRQSNEGPCPETPQYWIDAE